MSLKNLVINSLFLVILLATFTSCQKEDDADEMETKTFTYDFNTGQIDPTYAYSGSHPTDFSAELKLEEMEDDKTKITVMLMNPEAGRTYMVHAHDKADASTTPNNTPYNETPNSDVYAQMIPAADGSMSFTSDMSFEKLTTEYEGFFVIHDPLQTLDTTDPTTYLVLGNFAR
jgi:hypothetical protein